MTDPTRTGHQPTRRTFLAGAAVAGLAGAALLGAPRAQAATLPRLPGEISRRANQRTPKGTLYDAVQVDISGDRAWLMIPQSLRLDEPVGLAWFYHGAGSDHGALLDGFGYEARQLMDRGLACICQNAGGNQYVGPYAVDAQRAGWQYVSQLADVRANFLRGTSGGGALASEVLGAGLLPDIVGLYFVNGIWDVRRAYDLGGRAEIGPAYDFSTAAIDRTNPARHPASAWAGDRIRIVYSTALDLATPPQIHAIPFYERARQQGADVTTRTHTLGHATPSFVANEVPIFFRRWFEAWSAERSRG